MDHAIKVSKLGGPEVLIWREVKVGDPGPTEVRVRHQAVGLNYIDVYFRTGLYTAPSLPFTPGFEAAGVIEAVGAEVPEFEVGDRVAYASGPLGAYSEARLIEDDKLIPLPDDIEMNTAAGVLLKGMTAEYLLHRTYPVGEGDVILFHAAAGGVGLLACQWAKNLGATVIGTVSTEAKAKLAKENGCAYSIIYTKKEDMVAQVREITNGEGVSVVYDSVGQDTFSASLDCLAPQGLLVSFGQSSGKVPSFDISTLAAKGTYVTRQTLANHIGDREGLADVAVNVFTELGRGALTVNINQTFPLEKAADAHRALQGRETTGVTVLTV